jgi:hypothetical protein
MLRTEVSQAPKAGPRAPRFLALEPLWDLGHPPTILSTLANSLICEWRRRYAKQIDTVKYTASSNRNSEVFPSALYEALVPYISSLGYVADYYNLH